MADSNITKRALAQALKDLMLTQPFEKISVAEICEACEMNRKSFYYHFKDKYDLVEWIFESEFISMANQTNVEDSWTFLSALCQYFYRERSFYIKILKVTGQNSFRYYFHDYMSELAIPIIKARYQGSLPEGENLDFGIGFITDATVIAIFRWLAGGTKTPPEHFVEQLQTMVDRAHAAAKGLAWE